MSLERWLEREYRYAARAMLASVSPVGSVKTRPGFGQTIRAAKGAIVASPVLADWNPEPDYFFHWYRDSAVVVDALRLLHEDGTLGAEALAHLADFVGFSLALKDLDGRRLLADPFWRDGVAPDFVQYLRDDAELAPLHGDAVAADARVNPDGTLDLSRWARPQHDGPPARALALLRFTRVLDERLAGDVAALLRADLAYTRRHWREPCFDIWEEEQGRHYYTLRLSAAALQEGAAWLDAAGEGEEAQRCRAEGAEILGVLDGFWLDDAQHFRSRILDVSARTPKDLDIAVILAAIHAGGAGAHSVHDPRMQATLGRLAAAFDAAYPINRNRAGGRQPAMGRYLGDRYFSGGPWYVATLAAAEFCFRAAVGASDARAWRARGDGWLETVRAHTPDSGELSEQFDPRTGAQTSARHLAWSYAAFISCVAARRRQES